MLDDCVFLSDVLWGHKKQSYLTTSPDVKWLILEQPQTWRASDDRRTSPYTQQVRSERFKVAPISDDRILVDYLQDIGGLFVGYRGLQWVAAEGDSLQVQQQLPDLERHSHWRILPCGMQTNTEEAASPRTGVIHYDPFDEWVSMNHP